SITTTGTGHIERCRWRHRSRANQLQRYRLAAIRAFCAAIVSAASFTSISQPHDGIFAPYTFATRATTATAVPRATGPPSRAAIAAVATDSVPEAGAAR